MLEFHPDRDHAICNIQNHFILVLKLTQLRKLSNKDSLGTGVLKSSYVAERSMNNAWNPSIQNTPFMLNYGGNPDTPIIVFL
jgi:hypothetical protein